MTIFNHLQHAQQWELYLVVWNLHSSSQKRWWGFKTPAPTFKPALLQAWRSTQMHWLFRGRGKRSDQLVSQTRSLKFQYIVGSKEDCAYKHDVNSFYYLWQVQMMQELHFYTWTWKDNHSSEIWIIMHSDQWRYLIYFKRSSGIQ